MRSAAIAAVVLLAACGAEPAAAPDAADAPDPTDAATDATTAADADGAGVADGGADVTGIDHDADAGGDDASAVDGDALEDGDDATADDADDSTGAGDTRVPVELPEVVTTVVRAPEAGELAFAELMIDPIGRSDLVGEWIELASLADDATLDLAGCWLEDGAGRRFVVPESGVEARVSPGERFVVARSGDLEDNGGVRPGLVIDAVLMGNAAGSVAIGCGATELDRVAWDASWPLAPGRALVVAADPDGNDDPDLACAATVVYDAAGPNRGTPGAGAGEACPPRDVAVDACGLVAPGPGEIHVGLPIRAVAWAFEPDATDLGPGVDPIPYFRAEAGVGASAAELAWGAALPAPDALDAAHPERDAWARELPPLAVGPWVVGFRFSLDAGASWTTCGTVAIDVMPSPCDPNPCVATASVACAGDVLVSTPAVGACAVVGDGARCAFPEARLDCAALAGRCEQAACVDVATAPAPGEVVVTELMKNPTLVDDAVGEWVELTSVTDRPVQLAGCTLTDEGTDRVTLDDGTGALTVPAGGRVVVAATLEPAQNGGVPADWGWSGHGTFELLNSADAVVLTCGGRVIDAVRYTSVGWPTTAGRAVQLSPRRTTAADNDAAAAWCAAATAIGSPTYPDYGTPGVANTPCPEAVERCRLVAPAELDVVGGEPFTVAVQVRHAGLTDRSAAVDPDPLVFVQAGLGPDGWFPTWGGWSFGPAFPDPAWSDDASPREDQYLAVIMADPSDDVRDAAGRVTVDGGLTWTYCDRDSTLAGGDGSQDGYQTSNATRVVVLAPDPCLPNPCTTPPATACDADGRLVRYPAVGACDGGTGAARCSYAADVRDCPALGGTCDAALATCVGALPHPGPGDVVVTEVMAAPSAVADFFGEWFELASVAGGDLNLAGCALADLESSLTIDPLGHALVVAAGGRLVVGRDADPGRNGGVAVDFAWGDAFGLGNAGDRVALVCDGVVVDEVTWDGGWPLGVGVAMQLDPAATATDQNDAASAWCAAATAYGDGDLGTPGVANEACP